jgi:hypothetical protein
LVERGGDEVYNTYRRKIYLCRRKRTAEGYRRRRCHGTADCGMGRRGAAKITAYYQMVEWLASLAVAAAESVGGGGRVGQGLGRNQNEVKPVF